MEITPTPSGVNPTIEDAARTLVHAVMGAVDDPQAAEATPDPTTDVDPDAKDYRSFYITNGAFFAFRAAIYWSSRHPRAHQLGMDVPDNMSVAVERLMRDLTTGLEAELNHGERFPEPPPAKPRRRR